MENAESLSFEKSFFSEKDEVLALLRSLASLQEGSFDSCLQRVRRILEAYQEQPQLLGPHVEDLFAPLNEQLLEGLATSETGRRFHLVCRVVQLVCKVRGPKQCAKHFPHEVRQMELCIRLLKEQNSSDFETWEIRYVLLLWLGTLSLIPFDLSSIDSSECGESLVADLVSTCKTYLSDSGPTREAATICLSSLLTRPDLQSNYLQSYLLWSIDFLSEYARERDFPRQFLYLGTLQTFAQIFKRGHRDRLVNFVAPVLECVLELCKTSLHTLERKLLCKLVQRLGMALLPVREASWRYQRGRRTLNLTAPQTSVNSSESRSFENSSSEDESWDIPDVLEEIIEYLLQFLGDKDTVVRWSAAKGMGRVTMRLPKSFAHEVVSAIFCFFEDSEDDSRWHGGSLALAELTRRGLLLPENLPSVIPLVKSALHYDILKGQHGIGAHVRDAASYVCWSFARAYAPDIMRPFVEDLSISMLCAVLFDREVNCRRAAAAAFQENVGRQGHDNFRFGVEVIQIADYFTVGNRSACFLDHTASIASLDEQYARSFIDHLRDYKICHWDSEVRDLAAKAVAKVVAIAIATYDVDSLLVELIRNAQSTSLSIRHGSLLSLARIVEMLTFLKKDISDSSVLGMETLISEIEKKRLFRGRGSELVREAVCHLVESMANANVAMSLKTQVGLIEFLNEQLRQPHELVQNAARDALRQNLFSFFGSRSKGEPSERLQKLTWRKYVDGLRVEQNVAATRGYAMALGALPARLLTQPADVLGTVLSSLETFSHPDHKIAGEYDAETCRCCITSAREIFEKLCLIDLSDDIIERFFRIFLRSCEDYNVDKRGDTGSWSRIACLKAFETSLRALYLDRNNIIQYAETCLGPAAYENSDHTQVQFSFNSSGFFFVKKSQWMLLNSRADNDSFFFKIAHPITLPVTSSSLNEQYLTSVYVKVMKQLAEKLDSVRQVAGEVLMGIIAVRRVRPLLPVERFLCELLDSYCLAKMVVDWARPDHVFPFVCRALRCSDLVEPVLQGIVVSIGGLTESISKEATIAFVDHCSERDPDFLREITKLLMQFYEKNESVERVSLPLLKSIEILSRKGLFNKLSTSDKEEWEISLLNALWHTLRTATSIPKIMICVDLLGILATTGIASKAIESLANMLSHRYPRVRKYVSELLYVVIIGSDSCDAHQSVTDKLIETPWDVLSKEMLREEKAKICELLGVNCTISDSVRAESAKPSKFADELDSYSSLVRDVGY